MSGLNASERSQAQEVLGPSCQVRSLAVARLYKTFGSGWDYTQFMGAAAIVSDQDKNANFLRLVDFASMQVTFEQEFYDGFLYSAPKPWFHAFEADDCVAGLSFADSKEAQQFYNAVNACKSNQKSTSLNRGQSTPNFGSQYPSSNPVQRNGYESVNIPRGSQPLVTTPRPVPMDRPNPLALSSPAVLSTSPSTSSMSPTIKLSKKEEKEKKEREKRERKIREKLAKEDANRKPLAIGGPTGVTHVSHIGWDQTDGFQIRNIPKEWRALFQKAGITKSDLRNPETAAFIMNTVNTAIANGVLPPPATTPGASAQKSRAPPPPPSTSNRPPPPNGRPPPPPSNNGYSNGGGDSFFTPPPPPGPPPPPPVSSGSNPLLSAISNKQLKKVDPNDRPEIQDDDGGGGGGRTLLETLSNAMAQRRIELKEDEDTASVQAEWSDEEWEP